MSSKASNAYCTNFHPEYSRSTLKCQNYRGKERDIFIWGDSHAHHLIAGFSELYVNHNIYVMWDGGCMSQVGTDGFLWRSEAKEAACIKRNKKALEFLSTHPKSHVIISNAKRKKPAELAGPTNTLVAKLKQFGHTPIVVGDFIRPGVSLVKCAAVPRFIFTDERLKRRCVGRSGIGRREITYNNELAKLVDLRDGAKVQCDDKGKCDFFHDGVPMFWDDHHLSVDGSIRLVRLLRHELGIQVKY